MTLRMVAGESGDGQAAGEGAAADGLAGLDELLDDLAQDGGGAVVEARGQAGRAGRTECGSGDHVAGIAGSPSTIALDLQGLVQGGERVGLAAGHGGDALELAAQHERAHALVGGGVGVGWPRCRRGAGARPRTSRAGGARRCRARVQVLWSSAAVAPTAPVRWTGTPPASSRAVDAALGAAGRRGRRWRLRSWSGPRMRRARKRKWDTTSRVKPPSAGASSQAAAACCQGRGQVAKATSMSRRR